MSLAFLHCEPTSSDKQQEAVEEEPSTTSRSINNTSDMTNKDVLIIVGDSASTEAKKMVAELSASQEISDRVRIVRMEASQVASLIVEKGVYIIDGKTVPEGALASLSEGEKLFVNGWLAQIPEDEKARPGKGLDWDDPDFEPPDSLR